MRDLRSLTHESRVFWLVAIVCAVSRFAAMARSLWDWDEALFCLGMREYDVTSHHPHPPGFPVYIGLAKVARLMTGSDFHAFQALNLVAGFLVFPAAYLLAREFGARFETSVLAGALLAFFPNLWFFGGTAFSDVPSIVLVMFAATLLLRGRTSRRDYFIGTVLLAMAIGIRPQNLLIGLYPGIAATRRRPAGDVVAALVIGVAITGASFGAAVYATGDLDAYLSTVRDHSRYISTVDSFRSESRPPLWRIFDRFFFKQYQSAGLSIVTSLLVIASVIGSIRSRDRVMLRNFLTFAPFAIAAWLMLDRFSISRFSIGYAPMFAIFAADGIRRATAKRPRFEWWAGAALIAAFAAWTFPALRPVRNELSPAVRAVESVKQTFNPKTDTLFVGYSMGPFVEYLAPGIDFIRVIGASAVPLTPAARPFLLAEQGKGEARGLVFKRDRGRLWNIARRHYFEVFLEPMTNIARFESGWYEPERSRSDERRSMGAHSVTILPGAASLRELRITFQVPPSSIDATCTLSLNGRVIEQIRVDAQEIVRSYDVEPAADGAPNRLEIGISRTSMESGRPIGLTVRFLGWGPA